MTAEVIKGILIPFLGTAFGAACVFFMRKKMSDILQSSLNGFAAGVMVAASVWSLIIPAIEQSSAMGKAAFVPAVVGLLAGILFLQVIDIILAHLHTDGVQNDKDKSSHKKKTSMLVFAVSLHNLPEGMAVGVAYVGLLMGNSGITAAGAMALSIGIAIQNFPEGAIISMPLKANGASKIKAFICGVLSGVIEPIGAVFTLLAASFIIPALPYLLSFAAGSMLYVVVAELISEITEQNNKHIGTWMFALGFVAMMILDVTLG